MSSSQVASVLPFCGRVCFCVVIVLGAWENEAQGQDRKSTQMTMTEIAAWVGALSGLGSLAWNIYLKLTAGPKLEVSAFAGMVIRPSSPGDPKVLRITVCNNGTALTTLTNVTFHTYNSKWARWKGSASYNSVLNNFQGPPTPFRLEVGREWTGSMQQDDDFAELLKTQTLWCAVHHSFSKKPAQVKILNLGT